MKSKGHYFLGILVITPLWFLKSLWLLMAMGVAQDTPSLPVPLWLTLEFSIAFPMHYIFDLPGGEPPPGFSEQAYCGLILLAMVGNSVLWAIFIVYLLRLVFVRVETAKRG